MSTNQPEPEECEVLADGRVAHYMEVDRNGVWRCVRCPASAGKHGLNQPLAS